MSKVFKTTVGLVDRSEWVRGEWDNEPEDLIEWVHFGVRCIIKRNMYLGTWCGYVCLQKNNPLLSRVMELHWRIHGGITYIEDMNPINNDIISGEKWVGFDFCHAFDLNPLTELAGDYHYGVTYKNREFAIKEVEKLAEISIDIVIISRCNVLKILEEDKKNKDNVNVKYDALYYASILSELEEWAKDELLEIRNTITNLSSTSTSNREYYHYLNDKRWYFNLLISKIDEIKEKYKYSINKVDNIK